MNRLRFTSLLLFAFVSVCSARTSTVDISELTPSASQLRATELITHFMGRYHYRKTHLNDALSEQILKRYLDRLDPNHSYFLASDTDAFNKYRHTLDDALLNANLQAPFAIFRVYRSRVEASIGHAEALLKQNFDFTRDENYVFDRSEQPWPSDLAEREEIWHQRVKNDILSLRLSGKKDADIRETLGKRYHRIATSIEQLNAEDVFQFFINSYTASVEPHTSYFSPRTSENFKIRMSLSLEGIGAVLQTDNDYTLVREVIAGGPAAASTQLHPDDRIIGVGQGRDGEIEDVVGWRLDDVVDLIRGNKGSTVRLRILPKGSDPSGPSRDIALVRDTVKLEEQAAKKSVLEIGTAGHKQHFGVIDLPAFYMDFDARARGETDFRSTTRDVSKLLKELAAEDISGVIIDLRGNGGGSLTEAINLAGLFIATGPIVQVKDSSGHIEIDKDTDPGITYTGPLAVLVDRNSASASEIFAGAIQDYHRGIIIGEPTFGKGTVQNLIDLDRFADKTSSGMGQLKATIAQFFRINGDSTQHRGVVPDIIYPTALDNNDQGERALDNALPWAKVQPASFNAQHAPIELFAEARLQYQQRIAHDPAFHVIEEQTRATMDARERRSVSLLETRRRAEWKNNEARQKRWEQTLRAAEGLPPLADIVKKPGSDSGQATPDDNKDKDTAPDVLLREAGNILHDLIDDALPAHGTLHADDSRYDVWVADRR